MSETTTDDTTTTKGVGARAILAQYLTPGYEVHFKVLENRLAACGQLACVRAGLAAADAVREHWAWEASRPVLDAALDATRAWLATPGPATARRAHQASSRLLPLCRAVHRRTDEAEARGAQGDVPPWEDMRSCDVGTAAFGAARAAHARTARTAAAHATAAVAAAMSLLEIEHGTGLDDDLCPCCDGEELDELELAGRGRVLRTGDAQEDPAQAVLALAIRAALSAP